MRNKKLLLSLLFVAVLGMMTNTTMAKPSIDNEEEGVKGWTSVGPDNISGRVRAAMFDKYNRGVVYAGTVGGLYISVNNGKNWQELKLGTAVENVTALAQDDNGIVFVGTGEGFYAVGLHGVDPMFKNDAVSGKIGSGLYKIESTTYTKNWAENLATDEEKYNWAKENITFGQIEQTKVQSPYDAFDEWAFVNVMAYANGTLYVGTRNGGLKASTDGVNFQSISIEGNAALNIYDIVVSPNGIVAVAYDNAGGCVAINSTESPNTFTKIFSKPDNIEANFGRIKLTFGLHNPDYLYAYVADQSRSMSSSSEYTMGDIAGYAIGVFRTKSLNPVEFTKITPGTFYTGNQLSYAMSIAVNDADSNEIVYVAGDVIYAGQDVNYTGVFSWYEQTANFGNPYTGAVYEHTANYVPANIHNIMLMPNPQNAYDSVYMLATTDAGVYTYIQDTFLNLSSGARWFPSKGMNTLQAYKVSATPSGSVLAASQSNAVVLIPSVSQENLTSGMKIWSINNQGVPFDEYSRQATSTSAGAVLPSAINRTLPNTKVRKPMVLARPFTTIARTYGNSGDFDAVDDQTWTYGGGTTATQALLSGYTLASRSYAPFITPMDMWEDFDADVTFTLDTLRYKLSDYTYVIRDGKELKTIAGQEIKLGDSMLVASDNLEYPFWYVFSEIDRDVENYPTGDVLFMRWNETEDSIINLPQKVQSKTLLATEGGLFVCGKINDYSRTYTAGSIEQRNLMWTRIYNNNTYSTNFNRRIRNVALSQDGASAFVSVDFYTGYNTYDSTLLIRIDGLNDVDINDARPTGFSGSQNEANQFPKTTMAKFTRPISSIAVNPNDVNKLAVTFDNYSSMGANVVYFANAMAATPSYVALNAPDANEGSYAPVYTALFEKTQGALFIGTDKGIYKSDNYASGDATWTAENIDMQVPVYHLWQQTQNLPRYTVATYSSTATEISCFEQTQNPGVIYAATYGKGILMNNDYREDNKPSVEVGLNDAVEQFSVTSMDVYPNPASVEALISYSLNTPSTIVFNMYDVNGRLVSTLDCARQSKGAHSQLLDISQMNNGVYMIQMVTEKETRTAKLIIK